VTTTGPTSVPKLALPLALNAAGAFNTLQQDTPEEVAQCVRVLAMTRPGDRIMVPALGLPDPTFSPIDPATFIQACAQYEPRAIVRATPVQNADGSTSLDVSVAVAIESS
jgi:phage baseplate assembly protein W